MELLTAELLALVLQLLRALLFAHELLRPRRAVLLPHVALVAAQRVRSGALALGTATGRRQFAAHVVCVCVLLMSSAFVTERAAED